MVMNPELLVNSQLKSEFMEADMVEESPNGLFIRYDEVLEREAFKIVYKGFDIDNGREIAWNQIFMNEGALQSWEQLKKLLQEAVLLKILKHENIIKCYHWWVDKKNKIINMISELCYSGNLRDHRKKHQSVDVKAIKSWARQILRGLHCLHTRPLPIIHRDLKCENIFLNGNRGKIKIGDLGCAVITQKGTAVGAIGTPEFMAPEVYEGEYNQLVDIYSFGMCMLELITCEYPYSECQNPGQVYKKVISGITPAALEKVKDPQAKQFIEKCLGPASQRLPAAELLKDPFLSADNSKELVREPLQLLPNAVTQSIAVPKSASQTSVDADPNYSMLSAGTCTRSPDDILLVSELEIWRSGKMLAFRLRWEILDDNSIKCMLLIADCSKVRGRELEFIFNPDIDNALSVALELVQYQGLPVEEVPAVADLMDSLFVKLVAGWELGHGYCGAVESSYVDPSSLRIYQQSLRHPAVENHVAEGSAVSDISVKSTVTSASDGSCNEASRPADNSTDESIKGSKAYASERCERGESVITSDFAKNLEFSSVDSCSDVSTDMSPRISSLSLAD